jgi:hypothetical protein
MKWLRKSKEPSNVIPDDPATEKQVAYIISLVGEAGSRSKSVVRKAGIKGDPSSAASYSTLSKGDASGLVNGLLNVIPATDRQIESICHNFSLADVLGMPDGAEANYAKAMEIASPSGDPADPSSYSRLTKSRASAALNLLINS